MKAIVRIHYGKRTKEEREEAIKKAAIEFFKTIERKPHERTQIC